jgi:hypothetical protein
VTRSGTATIHGKQQKLSATSAGDRLAAAWAVLMQLNKRQSALEIDVTSALTAVPLRWEGWRLLGATGYFIFAPWRC